MSDESARPVHWLNIPNLITISRVLMAVVLFALIEADGWWKTATVLFADRRGHRLSSTATSLDGTGSSHRSAGFSIRSPTRSSSAATFVFLLSVGGSESSSGVTAWIVVVVLAREMFVTSLRGFLEKKGRDFSAALSGKLKMILQCAAVPLCLLSMDDAIVERLRRSLIQDPRHHAVDRGRRDRLQRGGVFGSRGADASSRGSS